MSVPACSQQNKGNISDKQIITESPMCIWVNCLQCFTLPAPKVKEQTETP